MAYHFTAEKRGHCDVPALYERLAQCNLVECFPMEVSDGVLSLGVSIPLESMNDPNFEAELMSVMAYLVTEQGFQVTDLFTGNAVGAEDILGLPERISA